MSQFTITTPASCANIGPGFDSLGIALNRYLTLHVVSQETWEFEHCSPLLPANEHYEDHLIYQVAQRTADRHGRTLPPCKVKMDSEITLARGLGSSASAVMAGRSEEHTSELQSRFELVCRLLLEKKDH